MDVCSLHNSCEDCLMAGDTFCGWCVLQNRCSRSSDCGEYWRDSDGCLEVTDIQPSSVDLNELADGNIITEVTLTVLNLPVNLTDVECVYRVNTAASLDSNEATTNITRYDAATGTVGCLVPTALYAIQELLYLFMRTGASVVTVGIGLVAENGVEFLTSPDASVIVDCSSFTSCKRCIDVGTQCGWCPLTFSCQPELTICPNGEAILYRVADVCPVLLPPAPMMGQSNTPYNLHVNVPSDVRPVLTLRATNLLPILPFFSAGLMECVVCVSDYDEVVFRLEARVSSTNGAESEISCLGETRHDGLFAIEAVISIVYTPLDLAIDSRPNAGIFLYTCGRVGEFCTECLSLSRALNCRYCISQDDTSLPSPQHRCQLSPLCSNETPSHIITAPTNCSAIEPPMIHLITPSFGPEQGETVINIEGTNLGVALSDIEAVTIGDSILCDVIGYIPGRMIVCETHRAEAMLSGPVNLSLSYQPSENVLSTVNYTFLTPEFGSPGVRPNQGPKSGGTPLTINGTNLDIGSSRSVTIGEIPCDVVDFRPTAIDCVTRPQPNINVDARLFLVTVSIDGWSRTTITYLYTSDPRVEDFKPLSSIESGGTIYKMQGNNLQTPQIRHLVFYMDRPNKRQRNQLPTSPASHTKRQQSPPTKPVKDDNGNDNDTNVEIMVPKPRLSYGVVTECVETWDFISEPCSGTRPDRMECVAPSLPPGPYAIGVLMDAACQLLDIDRMVTVHPDPFFVPFEDTLTFSETEFLNNNIEITILGEKFPPGGDIIFDLTPCKREEPCVCDVVAVKGSMRGDKVKVKERNTSMEDRSADLPVHNTITCSLEASNLVALNRDEPITMTAIVGNFMMVVGEIVIESIRDPASNSNNDNVITYAVTTVAIVIVVLLAIVVVVAILVYRWRVKRGQREQRRRAELEMKDHRLEQMVTEFAKTLPPKLFIHTKQLKIVESVGQGEYGIVYKAHLTRGGLPQLVAVKTVKGFFGITDVQNMMEEIVIMQQFNHNNVLRLLGVVVVGLSGPSIVMPFMANGNLSSYLRKNQETVILSHTADTDTVHSLQKLLMDVCLQVARGTWYLNDRNFIHRDLAARNCMIDSDGIIKVADFGLAVEEDVAKGYFRQEKSDSVRLPFKWMALESIRDGVFTTKTDVWSFGITMWEVYNGGRSPYPGVDPHALPDLLDRGHRLEVPSNAACSPDVYSIMQECWAADPENRPTFSSLSSILEQSLHTMAA